MPDETLKSIQSRLRAFRDARDWRPFHNPKDLSAAISVEASELQELFLWLSREDASERVKDEHERVSDELADVLIQALNFADIASIDPIAAMHRKIDMNEAKYPVD